MSIPPLEEVTSKMETFIKNVSNKDADIEYHWFQLRCYFVDLINKRITFDPDQKAKKSMEKIRNTQGFGEKFTEQHFRKVFPRIKYQYHLEATEPEKSFTVRVRPPTSKPSKTARSTNFKLPEIDLNRIHPPKTPRENTIRSIAEITPKEAPKTSRNVVKLMNELTNSPSLPNSPTFSTRKSAKMNSVSVKDETDAIKYIAGADPERDFRHFHVGTLNPENRYSFEIKENVDGKEDFQILTRTGVFTGQKNGDSEFRTIDEFVKEKAQFEMLMPIQIFSHFKLYKTFNYWRMMSIKKLFQKKQSSFYYTTWLTKKPFPNALFNFRRIILNIRKCQLFPIPDENLIEFDILHQQFLDSEEHCLSIIRDTSNDLRASLNRFAYKINDEYNFISSPRFIDYLGDTKVPADLLAGGRTTFKRGMSMTEEAMQKKKHEEDIARALLHTQTLVPFLKMCDRTLFEEVYGIFQSQIRDFSDIFTEKEHEVTIHTFLSYIDGDLRFSPSFEDINKMFDEHIEMLLRYFGTFYRPAVVDTTGNGRNKEKVDLPLRIALKDDPIINRYIEEFQAIVKESYDDAANTLEAYRKPALSIFNFHENWEEMKENEDPTIYIQNLTTLTSLREQINSYKMNYSHIILSVEAKALRADLLDILDKTIEENNNILFHNFEIICTTLVSEVKGYIETLVLKGDTLEDLASFNFCINTALVYQPSLEKNVQVVNQIFERANSCGDLLVPILIKSLQELRVAYENFHDVLKSSQNIIDEQRARANESLREKQKDLESKISALERQMRRQFAVIDPNMSPEIAIADIDTALEKISTIKVTTKEFEYIASRLNFSGYDFSQLAKVETELKQTKQHWNTFQEFMKNFNDITEQKMIGADLTPIIDFLNDHNEREMRGINHPLYERMANQYSSLSQYSPFFNIISRTELNPERWKDICYLLKINSELAKTMSIKKFLQPSILDHLDQVRSYIVDLQQREDLKKQFEAMIEELNHLSLKLVMSNQVNMKIVAFPSLYEATTICENFILYLKSLTTSPLYSSIQQACEFWENKLKISTDILNAMMEFQTNFVYLGTTTKSIFGGLHFPYELQMIQHIDHCFQQIIAQLEKNNHVLSLVPKSEEQFQNEINSIFTLNKDEIEEYVESSTQELASLEALKSQKSISNLPALKSMVSLSKANTSSKCIVNNDIFLPILSSEPNVYQGDFLVNLLNEAKFRCINVLGSINELLDHQRQNYPRFYFCTDNQVLDIHLACSNLRYVFDDLLPIFPALSRCHISVADTLRLMGVSNTNNEMYTFSREVNIEDTSVIEMLKKIEVEVAAAVRTSILDATSTREYSDVTKWLLKYPLQSILVAESCYFSSQIAEIFNKENAMHEWENLRERNEEILLHARNLMETNPDKIPLISTYISLKIRHCDIIRKIMKEVMISENSFVLRRHIFHNVTMSSSTDILTVTFGEYTHSYGFEMLAKYDMLPMTDAEEEALINFAACLSNQETFICKQMNGYRQLAKVFADLLGYPCFDINSTMLPNLMAAATSLKCIIRLKDCPMVPPAFQSFFTAVEEKQKVIKAEGHIRSIDINTCKFLVHVDSNTIPTWLQQRLRPIYLPEEPKQDVIDKIAEIRKGIHSDISIPVEIFSKAVLIPKPNEELFGIGKQVEQISQRIRIYFDLPEFLLTNRFVPSEDPFQIPLSTNLSDKIEQLHDMIGMYDGISPHSQSNVFPVRAYTRSISIRCTDPRMAMIASFAALRDSVQKIKPTLNYIGDDVEYFNLIGYRPISFEVRLSLDAESVGYCHIETFKLPEVAALMAHKGPFANFVSDVMNFVNIMIDENQEPESVLFNKILTKINLLRYTYRAEQSISMPKLIEAIFTNNYKAASVGENDELEMSLKYDMPIIITGGMSAGKHVYTKKLIEKYSSPDDILIISSAYNNVPFNSICSRIKFISRELYGPPDDKYLNIVIFDYHLAIREVKDFVRALMMYKCVYSQRDMEYLRVERVRLFITTEDPQELYDMYTPAFFVNIDNVSNFDWGTLESSVVLQPTVEIIKDIITKNNMLSLLKQFISINHKLRNNEDFLRVFSLFFGVENMKPLFSAFAINERDVIDLQNRNFNVAVFPADFNFTSRMIDLIELHLSAILIVDDMSYFRHVKNIEFVVLNGSFRNQLYTTLVRISQNKTRVVFLVDMKTVDWNEVWDMLNFFIFNKELPEAGTIFDTADLNILRYYISQEGTIIETFAELCSFISFFLIINDEMYENIPLIFRSKMVTIRPNLSLNKGPRQTNNDFIDLLQKYVHCDTRIFETQTMAITKELNERFQDFIDEIQLILQFFNNLTSLRAKIEKEDEPEENINEDVDMAKRLELLEAKIKEAEKKDQNYQKEKAEKTEKLNEITKKITTDCPADMESIHKKIAEFSMEDQVNYINQWLASKDEFFIFTNIFKDLFSFMTTANFTDQSANPSFCKLLNSIRQFNLSDVNSMFTHKLAKFSLNGESQTADILRDSDCGHSSVSSNPVTDVLISWLSLVVTYSTLNDERNAVSGEVTQLNNRNQANQQHLKQMQKQLEETTKMLSRKAGTVECPQWLLNAWNRDSGDVKKLFDALENATKVIIEIVSESADSEQGVRGIATANAAYRNGLCELPPKRRNEILHKLGIERFTSPFEFVRKGTDVQMLYPFKDLISIFTQATTARGGRNMISPLTSQVFNTTMIFDQLIFNDLLPKAPMFFSEKPRESEQLLQMPLVVYYDPMNIFTQTLVAAYPSAKAAFTSTDPKEFFANCISGGNTLILTLDSVESGLGFIDFIVHTALQINSMRTIMVTDQSKPVNSQFRLFIVTSIAPENFGPHKDTIMFADMSVDDVTDNQWFALATSFAVNPKIENQFVSLLDSVTTKINDFYTALRKLVELSHETWPEYFENQQKMLVLRATLDHLITHRKNQVEAYNQLTDMLSPNSQHPQAIFQYEGLTELSRYLVLEGGRPESIFQVLTCLKEFAKTGVDGVLTPAEAATGFERAVIAFANSLPCKKRIQFIANFETKHMVGKIPSSHLVFELTFPRLNERNLGPVMPQLVTHVCNKFQFLSESFFSFIDRDSIPDTLEKPVIVITDHIIPPDFAARLIANSSKTRSYILGSPANDHLYEPEAIEDLMRMCIQQDAQFIIVYDDALNSFILPAIIYYGHIHNFVRYYVVCSEQFADSIPLFPNALYLSMARPYTLKGCFRLLSQFPLNTAELQRWEAPMLYFLMLLMHRADFTLPVHQVIPASICARGLWQNHRFDEHDARATYCGLMKIILRSTTKDPVTRKCIERLTEYFFRSERPSIPGQSHVDFANETVFLSVMPPTAQMIGMVLNYGSTEMFQTYGWTEKLPESPEFVLGPAEDGAGIDATLVNGLWNGEITIIGSNKVTISLKPPPVVEEVEQIEDLENDGSSVHSQSLSQKKLPSIPPPSPRSEANLIEVGIYDGSVFIGWMKLPCAGNAEQWDMAGLRLYLPEPNL